ncbi:MAG TPA: alpha-amylase family glycosyl hydrolase [Cyclobacteriaceae bacterium]|nr:alpha-amylase family glycosyl hydrolase [Cyclobacteriaceae bacterium]
MKPSQLIIVIFLILSACQSGDQSALRMRERVAGLTVYEVNIRQHTAAGTLNAFTDDLSRLKELGVGVLWIMPVQPIGVKNRKEPLGSYYSIRNYNEINPEFGNEADFKTLVEKAHQLGMYVILDWVPNHTAWDHPWITEHPEYYAHDENGNIKHESDWLDIALLNHKNPETRKAMIEAMKFWVNTYQIDGFRCDHAGHEIPMYFWEEARAALDPIKDLFWLAEWDGARMHLNFDATYAWPLLHITDDVLPGKANANDIADWIDQDIHEYGQQPFRLTMITNHDENSWHGTEFERYGDGMKTFAAFIFTAYGMPMLYSGQEAGLNKRLKFFAKDTIDWSDPQQLQPFYRKLVQLHLDHSALWAGEYGSQPVRINERDSAIYAFRRTKGTDDVVGIMNFSRNSAVVRLNPSCPTGTYLDYFSGEQFSLAPGKSIPLTPWQYLILVK